MEWFFFHLIKSVSLWSVTKNAWKKTFNCCFVMGLCHCPCFNLFYSLWCIFTTAQGSTQYKLLPSPAHKDTHTHTPNYTNIDLHIIVTFSALTNVAMFLLLLLVVCYHLYYFMYYSLSFYTFELSITLSKFY